MRSTREHLQQPLPFEPRTPEPDTSNPQPDTQNLEPGTWNPEPVFVRHPRARRYIIRVAPDGVVRVTIPRRGSQREARAFAERERRWIEKERRRLAEERLSGRWDEIAPDVERKLRLQAKRELPPRLLALAAEHGMTVSRISVRDQRWRWGSCSPNGHICLNWRLVQMPESVRDYVLIHELMHIKRMDHSPKFWQLVAAACPGYREARRWLNAQPHFGGPRMIGRGDLRTAIPAPCSARSTGTLETGRAAPGGHL